MNYQQHNLALKIKKLVHNKIVIIILLFRQKINNYIKI